MSNGKSFEDFKRDMTAAIKPDDDDLGPCCMIHPKSCFALDVEDGAKPVLSFQFVFLSVRSSFTPERFEVLFVGMESWKLEVWGRNLRGVFDKINEHRLRRIRVSGRDFDQDDGKPFITKLAVTDVTPKD